MRLENIKPHNVKRFNTVDLIDIKCEEFAIISCALTDYKKKMQDIEIDDEYLARIDKVLNITESIYK
ncbi:MAG: hypothetical protein ACLSTJ_01745 [Clostridium neonatale]